jgi:hypothetical protein
MPSPLRINLDINDLVRRYRAGESTNQIAKSLGVSRSAIDRRLVARGIHLRSQGEAEALKWARIKQDPEAVRRQCGAAWAAARGRRRSMDELVRCAKSRARLCSPDELPLLEALRGFGVEDVEHQHPCGPYNVDFALHGHGIAVEHMAVGLRADSRTGYSLRRERVEYLRSTGGLQVVALVVSKSFRRCHGVKAAAEHLVAHLDVLRRNPPPVGQYWVVACRCDSSTRPRVEVYQRAAI